MTNKAKNTASKAGNKVSEKAKDLKETVRHTGQKTVNSAESAEDTIKDKAADAKESAQTMG